MKYKPERFLPIWYFATKPFWWILAESANAIIWLIEKNGRIFSNMQTKAQKIISRHQRLAKRTQKQTWADVDKLNEIVRSGDGDFYRQAMSAILCLRRLNRKTQENAFMWKSADEVVQRLLQLKGRKESITPPD